MSPILRLAYTTQFLIALVAVFVLWAQVGGQSHLDLLPWFIKLGLGVAAAYAMVRATSAAVSGERGWNGHSVRWVGVALVLACLCGLASYYAHMYLEDDQEADPQQDTTISRLEAVTFSSVPVTVAIAGRVVQSPQHHIYFPLELNSLAPFPRLEPLCSCVSF